MKRIPHQKAVVLMMEATEAGRRVSQGGGGVAGASKDAKAGAAEGGLADHERRGFDPREVGEPLEGLDVTLC